MKTNTPTSEQNRKWEASKSNNAAPGLAISK
jgi:hypothetical protein